MREIISHSFLIHIQEPWDSDETGSSGRCCSEDPLLLHWVFWSLCWRSLSMRRRGKETKSLRHQLLGRPGEEEVWGVSGSRSLSICSEVSTHWQGYFPHHRPHHHSTPHLACRRTFIRSKEEVRRGGLGAGQKRRRRTVAVSQRRAPLQQVGIRQK
jgi:hypothetical protein